jgi:hypothetical protein
MEIAPQSIRMEQVLRRERRSHRPIPIGLLTIGDRLPRFGLLRAAHTDERRV